MKIVVIGTRGIPDILGGVETHCQELYPRIAQRGHDVTVVRRTPYVQNDRGRSDYRGVKLVDVYAPRKKSIEAIIHTFLAVIKARQLKPDILHVHAIGPGLMVPFARLLGMRVVATNHGPDYDRGKWGRFAKFALRTGQYWAAKTANRVIVISKVIADILADKCRRHDTDLIFNGVNMPQQAASDEYLRKWGLTEKPYIVAIGRFVKEKGFHDLIDAYVASGLADRYALAIAGDADHEDAYSLALKEKARAASVVLTGFIKGEPLTELMHGAALFVMPSYHEGLPIALLEALSYGLDVVVSDIPANKLSILDEDDFFPTGNIEALAQEMKTKLSTPRRRTYDLSQYDWENIADATINVYRAAAKPVRGKK